MPAEDEWQPFHLAVIMKFGNRQRARRQQPHIRSAILGIVASIRDEAIYVVEAGIVAAIDDDAAVLVDEALGALVPEAAKRGMLHRNRAGVGRIDLDDPTEAVGFVRLFVDIEPVDELAPGLPQSRHAVALEALGLSAAQTRRRLAAGRAKVAPEITVEVLLRRQIRAPGRHSSGAIVERAEDALT